MDPWLRSGIATTVMPGLVLPRYTIEEFDKSLMNAPDGACTNLNPTIRPYKADIVLSNSDSNSAAISLMETFMVSAAIDLRVAGLTQPSETTLCSALKSAFFVNSQSNHLLFRNLGAVSGQF
jgi:hypothetical protein